MKPPSAEALAAAAAVPTRPRKVITVSAADLEWITSHGPCSEEAARFLMQLTEGNVPVAIVLCGAGATVIKDKVLEHLREFLSSVTSHRVTQAEADELLTLLGVDLGARATERAVAAARSERGVAALGRLVAHCNGPLHAALVDELPPAVSLALARPREWLSTHWSQSAVPRYLAKADFLLGIGKGDVCTEARAAFGTGVEEFEAAEPARSRVRVEVAWLAYTKAMAESHGEKWELGKADVEFERVRQNMRAMSGMEEPEREAPPGSVHAAALAAVMAAADGADAAAAKPGVAVVCPPPRLADLACHAVLEGLELEAARRGHATRCAPEEHVRAL